MSLEARNRLLPDWFARIRTHQTVLPRFQRYEAWDHARVAQLFNTILQQLPIGSSLVLEIGDKEPFVSRPIKGAPEHGERVTEHLLDGQQRLTALWRGLHNNYADRTYYVCFEHDPDTNAPYYVKSVARYPRKDKRLGPLWADDPAQQWDRKLVPLNLFLPVMETQSALRTWVREAITDRDEQDHLTDQAAVITQQFATFNLPFLALPASTSPDTALEVFIRMNTSAAALTIYDIVVAQVEATLGTSLHDLVSDTRQKYPRIDAYYRLEELVLYASALLQDKPPVTTTYIHPDFGSGLQSNWDTLQRGVGRTVTFLEEERIFDNQRLPTDVVVPALVALWARVPDALDGAGRARNILRKYTWRAFFTNRYEKSTNSRVFEDFRALRDLIAGSTIASVPALDLEKYPLPQVPELIDAGWPVRKDRLARAILALALRHGGNDLADGSEASVSSLTRREYHHLFPRAYLAGLELGDEKIFRSLNCALVSWQTNRTISDKEPERYLAQRRDANGIGEAEIRARLATHYIPYDEMVAGDYDAFLKRRAELMHAGMTTLCKDGITA